MQIVKLSLISIIAFALSGCASDVSREMRVGGIESKELYRNAAHGNASKGNREAFARTHDIRRVKHMIGSRDGHEPYTRNAMNETEQLFKLLPNPKITIYVYPHLSTSDNAPIPGYTTAVSLYRADEYALPTELVAQGRDSEPVETSEPVPAPRRMSVEQIALEVDLLKQMNRQAGASQ